MSRRSSQSRDNAILTVVALTGGALAAALYGAWRAVSQESASSADRWSTFAGAMLFPGLLIVAAIAAMVWLGWKANID